MCICRYNLMTCLAWAWSSQADGQRPQQSLGSVSVAHTQVTIQTLHCLSLLYPITIIITGMSFEWWVSWELGLSGDNLFVVCLLPNDRTHSSNEMQILLTLKH